MKVQYFTNSPSQTKKLGELLAKEILSRPQIWGRDKKTKFKTKKALILGLEGDLGGGKTTFLQGFAKGLGIKEKILSPTFVILKRFKIPQRKPSPQENKFPTGQVGFLRGKQDLGFKFQNFYHIDCYRIKRKREILDLGFQKIISDNKNIVVIEWSDRIRKILPKKMLKIKFKIFDKNRRKTNFGYGK